MNYYPDKQQSISYERLNATLRRIKEMYGISHIYAEPSDGIVKSSGRFITRVVAVQARTNYMEVFLDAGINVGWRKRYGKLRNLIAERYRELKVYKFYNIIDNDKMLFFQRIGTYMFRAVLKILIRLGQRCYTRN